MGAAQRLQFIFGMLFAGLLLAANGKAQILVDGAGTETVTLTGSTRFHNVNVTSASATNFTFTLTEQDVPTVAWLSVCVAGGSCAAQIAPGSGTTPAALNIQINNDLASFGSGPFNATVNIRPTNGTAGATINVSFVPGPAGGITATAIPSSLTVTAPSMGSATSTVVVENQTAEPMTIGSITATTMDGSSWLSASTAAATINADGTALISVVTDASSLPAGNYSGSVQIVTNPGAPVLVPVSFTVLSTGITVGSGSLAFSFANGISTAQQLTIAGPSTYSASANTVSGGSWLILSAGGTAATQITSTSSSQPLTILIGTPASSLQAGTYQGSITLTGSDGSRAIVGVVLLVNLTPPTAVAAYPASLSFAYQINAVSPPPQTIVITAPANSSYTVSGDQPWISPATVSGTIPGNLQIFISTAGLSANTYSGNVIINSGNLSQMIPVTLAVSTEPVVYGTFAVTGGTTGTVLFSSQGATATPSSQVVALSASDGSAPVYSLNSYPNWTSVTLANNQLTITPNVSGLAPGVYSGNVVVTATGPVHSIANTPASIPVILTANGGAPGTGVLTLSQPSLTFQGTVNGTAPPQQTLTVGAATATLFSASPVSSWLTISPTGNNLTTPQNLIVSANPVGLSGGSYSGAIQLTAGGVTQSVPVTFQLSGGSGGNITTDETSLSFNASVGSSPPAGQTVTVSNSVSGTAPVTFGVSTSQSWLKSSVSQGSTQQMITITVDPTGLAANTYTGSVVISPSGGAAVNIGVTFTVQAAVVVSVGTTALSFVYHSGGAVPSAQTVLVSGGGGFSASAATSDHGNWLSVSPQTGTAGSNVSVVVSPNSLSAGAYNGTVTVSGTNGLSGQAVINVSLVVLGVLPTVDTIGNAASYIQGPVSAGEVITLKGSNLGPAQPVTAQLDSTGKIATTLGGVQVVVSGFLAPMIYASANQVSAIIPYEVARLSSVTIAVKYLGQTSNAVTLAVAATAPGIFTQDSTGSGAAGFNANFSVNGPNNPAPKGGFVILFLTGEGLTNPPGVDGAINPNNGSTQFIPVPAALINVFVNGQLATYTYAGGVPGTVEGVMQLNVQIPPFTPSGNVPVNVVIGGNSTQSGITLSVQ